jgi:hypothetical protein
LPATVIDIVPSGLRHVSCEPDCRTFVHSASDSARRRSRYFFATLRTYGAPRTLFDHIGDGHTARGCGLLTCATVLLIARSESVMRVRVWIGGALSGSGATVDRVSGSSDSSVEQLEDQLEGAERTLSTLGALSDQQAERVAQRMDRLASQLLEVSAPSPMHAVHERLATSPASREEFDTLADEMGAADGEG